MRYAPPLTKEQQQSFDEKVNQYRYPTPSYRSPTPDSHTQLSPQTSLRPLLPVHQERSASQQSFYSYPSSPSIGRAITAVSDLQQTVTPPERSVAKFPSSTTQALSDHARQGSTDSLGLPAPPRHTRSPVLHQPSIEQLHPSVRTINGTWTPVDSRIPRQPSSQTFGRRDSHGTRDSTHSPLSADFNSGDWSSRQANGGLSPHGRPLLSAVNSGFSSPRTPGSPSSPKLPSLSRHSRSFSAVPAITPAPTGRQRAVLASKHGSFGSSAEFGHMHMPLDQNRF